MVASTAHFYDWSQRRHRYAHQQAQEHQDLLRAEEEQERDGGQEADEHSSTVGYFLARRVSRAGPSPGSNMDVRVQRGCHLRAFPGKQPEQRFTARPGLRR
ncbi:hypothetical protein V502_01013 [Pseudogymnoascus sp. VKM F-4520 (FW-2644)]|nr:hypothetical protein V502_01013 [Pseudogymnoascus sp. VKM F-4520 (FW-2644)]